MAERRDKLQLRNKKSWPEEKFEQMFDAYEANECLWKKGHVNYFRPHLQLQQKIAKSLNCSVAEMKARWTSMRQTFMKNLKKEKRAGKNGKFKKWRYLDRLRFLSCEVTEPGDVDSNDTQDVEVVKPENPESFEMCATPNSTSSSPIQVSKKRKSVPEPEPVNLKKPALGNNRMPAELNRQIEDKYDVIGRELGGLLRRLEDDDLAEIMELTFRKELYGALLEKRIKARNVTVQNREPTVDIFKEDDADEIEDNVEAGRYMLDE